MLSDIVDSISDQGWCLDPYIGRKYDEDFFTWELFCNQIKYETRYVFFRSGKYSEPNIYGNIYKQPYEIMETIGESLEQLDLVRSKDIHSRLYRGRSHHFSEEIKSVDELGPPNRDIALYPNRMSPVGIPMFYGAMDERTAVVEIQDEKPCIK